MNITRRSFAALAGAIVVPAARLAAQNAGNILVPHASWNCGMSEGIPNPESGTLIFEARMKLERLAMIGKTQYGNRRVAVGDEGEISGPKLTGNVMTGALDLELTLANGVVEMEEIFVFKAGDGKYILSRSGGVGANAKDVRMAMDFEAPNGSPWEWLNTGKYVGRRILDEAAKTLTLRVYDVATAKMDVPKTQITKPAGATPQPWDYRKRAAEEKPGKELITEMVGLSPSQTVGASKHGSRNIIPIAGGDLSGRINGKVLNGGADYQNRSGPAIDARYMWQAGDGEIILVRNTTGAGGLAPTFEARVDGPYAYLNSGLWVSSDPSMANGGVKIVFSESTK